MKTFIDKANKAHNNKYDYSKVDYKKANIKVKIVCPEHGVFEQRPKDHVSGQGCRLCSNKIAAKKRSNSKEDFINKAKKKHGNLYDYSQTYYINSKTKINIICPMHGIFQQTPVGHLFGYGCPKCGLDKRLGARREQSFK